MKSIAILRSNIRDATSLKVISALLEKYNIYYYAWDRDGCYEPVIVDERLRYRYFQMSTRYHSVTTLIKLAVFNVWLFFKLILEKIDIIHAADLDTALVGLIVARIKRIPFVYHCIDPYYASLPPGWPKVFSRIASRIENLVISGSDLFVITDLLRMGQHSGAKPKRVVEFANVPMSEMGELPDVKDNNKYTIGYIGVFEEGRNILTYIETVGEIGVEGVRLILGGFGSLEKEVEERASMYDNVDYLGYMSYQEVLKIEKTFDAFIYVSDFNIESQKWVSPNKLFESMAMSKPIIVGEKTLVAERVAGIGNGIVIKYGSKDELKNAVLKLRDNPDLAKGMGAKGRQEFVNEWNPEIMKDRLLRAYGSIDIA